MKVYRDYPLQMPRQARAVALGFFDGVHLGHRELLRELYMQSQRMGLRATVFTFAEHPSRLHSSDKNLAKLLNSCSERIHLIEAEGIEDLVLAPLIPAVTDLEAADFMQIILKDCLAAKAIVVGEDFRFGHRAGGTVEDLRNFCESEGISLTVCPDVRRRDGKVSSTRLRSLVEEGEMEQAERYLGRAFSYSGVVIHGQKLGSTRGFATANLALADDLLLPRAGVYAGLAKVSGRSYEALVNIGQRPTVNVLPDSLLEAHLLGFSGDLYGSEIQVELRHFIRDERKFISLDALYGQIKRDCAEVRHYFEKAEKVYEYAEINGRKLNCCFSDRFLNARLRIALEIPLDPRVYTEKILLARILEGRNRKYPRREMLEAILEESYGAEFFTRYGRGGACQRFSFNCESLVREMGGTEVMKALISEFLDCILDPPRDADGLIPEEIFNEEKQSYIVDLESRYDDKVAQALDLARKLCNSGPFVCSGDGLREAAGKLKRETLTALYTDFISSADWSFEYCGPYDEQLLDELTAQLKRWPTRGQDSEFDPVTRSSTRPCMAAENRAPENLPLRHVVASNAEQSLLIMVYAGLEAEHRARSPQNAVLAEILGGEENSLLFTELREKNSLCYSAYCVEDGESDRLYLIAELRRGSETEAEEIIRAQIARMQRGDFDDSLLEDCRQSLTHNLLGAGDSLSGFAARTAEAVRRGQADATEFDAEVLVGLGKAEIVTAAKRLRPLLTLVREGRNE